MTAEKEYKILFTKLDEAIKEQEHHYELSFQHDPIENEQIRELAEICNQLDEQTAKEEYNSFTRS
jgi:hypothetical protein